MTSPITNKRSLVRRSFSAASFTLIELLGVIVIMALIAAIGFPALKALSGTALQTGARQFSNALILARQYSINNRTPVRVALAVDYLTMTNAWGRSSSSNYVCRAYSVYLRSNDVNGAEFAWWPLQDWRTLPNGVVFSDHNVSSYSWVSPSAVPPPGANSRALSATGGTSWQTFNHAGSTMPLITNITAGASPGNVLVSYIEFRPTGAASTIGGGAVAGVRLALGAVTDPTTRTIVINNTSNWVYVEYDTRNGRVRTRYPESYQ